MPKPAISAVSSAAVAIVGTYADEAQFERLKADLEVIGTVVFKPTIATAADETAEIASLGNWRSS